MKMYTTLMSAYGTSAGIQYRFDGTVANTMQAHRLIQHYQEEKGSEVANAIIDCTQSFSLLQPASAPLCFCFPPCNFVTVDPGLLLMILKPKSTLLAIF